MSFANLYNQIAKIETGPIVLDRDVVPFLLANTAQDEIKFVAVDLDPKISLGHIKQYRWCKTPYDTEPVWISQIRYHRGLNACWRRFVCCKELMHIFDDDSAGTPTADRLMRLLEELESGPMPTQTSAMYFSEIATKWMAHAILCPLPLRNSFKAHWRNDMSDYDIALALRIPEENISAVMNDAYEETVQILLSL